MREEIDLYNIGDTNEELKRALLALRQDFDAHIHDGVNSKSFETIRAETFSGRVISIKKTLYTDTVSGLWTGLVGATAKLNLGNGTTYLKWDGSALTIAGNATFSGTLSAAAGTLGAITIGANAWHVDSSGNMWWGNYASYAAAVIKISAVGSINFTTGTFSGTLSAPTGTLGTVTITGTFKTAGSGQRIAIGALSEGFQVYNTDGTQIALIQPTDTGALFSATSPNTADRMFQFINFIQAGYNANPMVYLEAANVNVGTTILELNQKGDKTAFIINSQTTSSGAGMEITHLGDGLCGDFYLNNVDANNYAVRVRSTAIALPAFYAEHSINTQTAAQFKQSGAVVANGHNYYRIISLNGGGITKVIWLSDGNSPLTDGLSGNLGDICLNCDGGKMYYNTDSGTTWAAA